VEGAQQIVQDVEHLERPRPVCPAVPRGRVFLAARYHGRFRA
jgi:hypothetical protein